MTYELNQSDMVFTMTMDEAKGMAHQGQCDEDVRAAVGEVSLTDQERQNCRDAIESSGAHDAEELADWSDEYLVDFVVWMAAGNIVDGQGW